MVDLPRTILIAVLLGASGCSPATKPGTDGAAASAAATTPAPPPSASAAASALPAPDAAAAFRCFSWAHQRDFSTDCYRTQTECLTELTRMKEGARLPTECAPREHASCTTLRGVEERCFGDAANCARYRAFVGRNHIETTECAPR